MGDNNLLGPPELHKTTVSGGEAETKSGDEFMDLMFRHFNRPDLPGRLRRGLTPNGSPTYLDSGNPCLDLFFHALPNTPSKTLNEKLRLSWAHDPLATLKLVANLRGVRGTGKSDKEGFFTAALWLHRHHPRTLASNVASLAEFGCFKDLPEILLRLLEGPQVRRKQRAEWRKRKGKGKRKCTKKRFKKRLATGVPREIRVSRAEELSKLEKEQAREIRVKARLDAAKKVTERYSRNYDFRFLYDSISDHFAQCLKNDLDLLKSGHPQKISLAAKWCPSLDSSFDRRTLLCEGIAKRIFPRESSYQGVEEAHYAYRVRDRLRKEVLVPLRKALDLTEVFIGAGRWSEIPYDRVPSVAMKFYKETFLKHDGERFLKHSEEERERGQVSDRKAMKKCLAVCDVSRSMRGKALEASLALGLVVSEMSEAPWKGKMVTFGDDPKLHVVEGRDLRTKLDFLKKKKIDSCGEKKKDIQKVFDLILQVAVEGKVREEDMIKRVFVFSDMDFDRASPDDYDTNYDVIVRRFAEKGYGSAVPEMVFWKLRDSESTPVPATQKGVAMVSGFSKNLMRLFLDRNDDGEIDPVSVMESAISGHEYQSLVVLD